MIKPDWTQAPAWAQWFAIDDDGTGWWWSTKPIPDGMTGCWLVPDSKEQYDTQPTGIYPEAADDWKQSLRQRPAEGEGHDRA